MLSRFLKAALLLILAGCPGRDKAPSPAAPQAAQAPAQTAANKADEAPSLKVELYVPLGPECHRKTVDLVKDCAARSAGRIKVVILPMGDYKSDQEMRGRGITCATVLIDGKTEFDLPDGKGGTRRAVFSHKPNEPDSTYSSEDVVAAIDMLLKGN